MKRLAIINTLRYRIKRNIYARGVIDRIRKELGVEFAFTKYAGHAENIAMNSSGYDIIIAVGGDGTISEVVNGINTETQALAIIPLGTGNNLAKDLRLTSLTKIYDIINKNNKIKIDLIHCRFKIDENTFERYAVTTSGIGLVAAIANFCNRYLKIAGPLCYPLSTCCRSFRQEKLSAKVQINDAPIEEIEFTNFIINNTKYAGNVCIFPRADLGDSLFNLFFARTNVFTQQLWNVAVATKTYFYYPGEKAASKLHIILNRPCSLMLDGEIINPVKEIEYSIAPQKLTVLA